MPVINTWAKSPRSITREIFPGVRIANRRAGFSRAKNPSNVCAASTRREPITLAEFVKKLDPGELLGALILAGILFVAGVVLSWAIRKSISELKAHDDSGRLDRMTVSFLSRLAILALWLVVATIYAHLAPPLHRLGTALLAGVSLMSVVVGFAAQTTLGNLVSGIGLGLYKPFRRGDRLQVLAPTEKECEAGVVEDISLGFAVLSTHDYRKIIVANGAMAQQTMIKLNKEPAQPAAPP